MSGMTVVKWSKETGYGADQGKVVDFRESATYKNIASEITKSGGGGTGYKSSGGQTIVAGGPTVNGSAGGSSIGNVVGEMAGKLGISQSIIWLMVGILTVGLVFKR
jgi:hypothetical protein